jgi:hypothetical protein
MRLAFIGLVTLGGALTIGVQSGNTQESFFNARYCTMPSGSSPGSSGVPDCAYNTLEQCIESAHGLQRWCSENRNWHGPRQQPTTPGKTSRRKR